MLDDSTLVDLVDSPFFRSRETRDLLVANCLQMPKRRRSGTEGRPALWAGNMLIPKIWSNRPTIANGG